MATHDGLDVHDSVYHGHGGISNPMESATDIHT